MFIRIIDFESTALDPSSGGGVCEIGWCDLSVDKRNLLGEPCAWKVGQPRSLLTNPGCPIPPETSAVHHLIDSDVALCDGWKDALRYALTSPSPDGDTERLALAAHSAKFERLWVDAAGPDYASPGIHWLCTYKLSMRLWPDAPTHSNMGLRYWRKPEGLRRDLAMPAHRAGPDAYVTAFLLRELLEQAAQDQSMSFDQAVEWSNQPVLETICQIGKQRGTKWADVDDGFLNWLIGKDFNEDVLFTAHYWLDKRQKEWEAERAAERQPL